MAVQEHVRANMSTVQWSHHYKLSLQNITWNPMTSPMTSLMKILQKTSPTLLPTYWSNLIWANFAIFSLNPGNPSRAMFQGGIPGDPNPGPPFGVSDSHLQTSQTWRSRRPLPVEFFRFTKFSLKSQLTQELSGPFVDMCDWQILGGPEISRSCSN